MSILHRERSLLSPDTLRAGIPIDSSLSRETQLNQWLDTLPPRACRQHKHTQLVLDRDASIRESLSSDNPDRWYRRRMSPGSDVPDAKASVNQYAFDAVFRCPACRVAYSLCPPEFYETSFGTFDASTPERTAALAKAREFAAQVNAHGCGFSLFVGLPGTGKTRLACNIVRELEARDALYVRQGELTSALRATYGRKDVILHRASRRYDPWHDDEPTDEEPPTVLEIVQGVGFLVLDEVGCIGLANDERLILDELLKYRYEHRKPTILISNLPLSGSPESPGLKEFLGDALTDRIKDATGDGKFIVQFAGNSYRRTTGESYLKGLS